MSAESDVPLEKKRQFSLSLKKTKDDGRFAYIIPEMIKEAQKGVVPTTRQRQQITLFVSSILGRPN